jgi:hypothetical protein
METSKNESDISPLIPDTNPENNKVKTAECCDFLQCCACSLIILFTCFKPYIT